MMQLVQTCLCCGTARLQSLQRLGEAASSLALLQEKVLHHPPRWLSADELLAESREGGGCRKPHEPDPTQQE